MVDELPVEGINLGGDPSKQLKYPLPEMDEYAIGEYLSDAELQPIAGDADDVDYNNMSEREKSRYDKFVEAWFNKLDNVPAAPTYDEPL